MSKEANTSSTITQDDSKPSIEQKKQKVIRNTKQQIETHVKAIMRFSSESALPLDYHNQIDSLIKEAVILSLTDEELIRAVEDSCSESLLKEYYPIPLEERRKKGIWHLSSKLLELKQRRQQIEVSVQHNIAMLDAMKGRIREQIKIIGDRNIGKKQSPNDKKINKLKSKMEEGL